MHIVVKNTTVFERNVILLIRYEMTISFRKDS